MKHDDIAIVGLAGAFPQAANVRRFWSNVVNGVDAITEVPPYRWQGSRNNRLPPEHEAHIPCSRGGFLPDGMLFDPMRYGVMPKIVKDGDPDQFLTIQIVDEALRDAGVSFEAPIREKTDIIVGRGGYTSHKFTELVTRVEAFDEIMEVLDRKFPEVIRSHREELEAYFRSTLPPKDADAISTCVPNIVASRAANRLNLRGTAIVVDAACASSLIAVEQAVARLRSGASDMAIASGIFLTQQPTFWYVFTKLGAISPSGQIRPLDERSDGLVVGEGCGAIVLKRLDDAIRDGDRIYSIIKGVGSASDGREYDVLAPSYKGQVRALEQAYANANVDPDTIGYLELHGTGTVVGDLSEIESLKQFYGRSTLPAAARAMGSVKSMIGHLMPAAGIAAMIKTALSLSNKILPPSLHCEQPRKELLDANFYVNTKLRPWVHNEASGPRRAGVNAFGFGGINCHVVLEEVIETSRKTQVAIPRDIEPGVQRETDLAVFSGATTTDVIRQVERLEQFLTHDGRELTPVDIAAALAKEVDESHPCKLAVLFADLPQLREQIAICLKGLAKPQPTFAGSETIYYATNADKQPGKLAFIFPGMGFPGLIGNYPDHLLELALHYPEVRSEFDFFEERDRHPEDTVPTSSIFMPPASLPEAYRTKLKQRLAPPKLEKDKDILDDARPEERYLAAMGVTLSNWIGWSLLKGFDFPVDMVAGQSQGEMAALCAAGCTDFHEAAPKFWKMLNVNPRYSAGQRMCFAWATEEKLQPLLDAHPGTYFAIHMAPEAIVFGGPTKELEAVAEILRQQQVLVQILPYPPIHTPCLSYIRESLDAEMPADAMPMQAPKIDLYSSILAEKYPNDPAVIRDWLMLNIDHPLRVWQTVKRLYADGARVFVQVGGGHMATHLKSFLPTDEPLIAAALDMDIRNPLTQLNHLCAILFTSGVKFRFDPLFAHRPITEVNLGEPQPAPERPRTAVPFRLDWTAIVHPSVPREPSPSFAADYRKNPGLNVETPAPVALPVAPEPAVSVPEPVAEAVAPVEEPVIAADLPDFSACGMPLIGRITAFEPEQSLTMVRRVALDEDLYLEDHCFILAKEVKPIPECLPIVPMTMSIEMVSETAALLAPGLGLLGFENIRALRWVGLEDVSECEVRVEAKLVSVDDATGVRRIQVDIHMEEKLRFAAVVLYGTEYRQDLPAEVCDSSQDPAWPCDYGEVYEGRRMFHGPAFHVISDIFTRGNPGFSGELIVRPKDQLFASNPNPVLLTDPCLMDGIGQFVGLFCNIEDLFILPTSVEKLEYYCPVPPVGTRCLIRAELVEYNPDLRQIRFNVEVEDGSGNVWIRAKNWADYTFNYTPKFLAFAKFPAFNLLSDEIALPGLNEGAVCCLMRNTEIPRSTKDWAARKMLDSAETRDYYAQPEKQQIHFLGSKCAAKDAARVWWARRTGESLHPASMHLGHDELGKPFLAVPQPQSDVHLSVSHSGNAFLGIAADYPVGIDMEPADRDATSILPQFATEEEIAFIENAATQTGDGTWAVRLWCAKEAASKSLGTGLQGRPKDFQAIDLDADGGLLIQHRPSGQRCVVQTSLMAEFVVALATLEGSLVSAESEAERTTT